MSCDDCVIEEPHERGNLRMCHWKPQDGTGAANRVVHGASVNDEKFTIVTHSLIS